MPDTERSVLEQIETAAVAIRGEQDNTVDFIRGSDYESLAGPNAIIWSREGQRDADLFRAIRFLDADSEDLTDLVFKRYGVRRIMHTRGAGTAVLERLGAAVDETIWKGTRIMLGSPLGEAKHYRVTANTPVLASATAVIVPIEAVIPGPGSAVQGASQWLSLEDQLAVDWAVRSLSCADGTEMEGAGDYRARSKRERIARRVGHASAIIEKCKEVGAGQAVVFRSDHGGDALDHGLNVVYVGDLSYTGTADLVRSCQIALRSVRVAGDQMQVFPLARAPLTIDATVVLRDGPAVLPVQRFERLHRAAILQYHGGAAGAFTYTRAGIFGSIVRNTPEVQDVVFNLPTTDASVLVNGNFPSVLNRYYVTESSITLRYVGP